MHIPRALVMVALILGSGLFLSACSSAPTSETTSAPAGSTEPAESSANLSTCEKVIAGYIVQMPDGEFDVCPIDTSYATST